MTLIKVKSRGTDNVTGRKNILYNGAMQIHQRGNTTTAANSSKYFVDRFNVYHNGNQAVANLQQSTDVPSGNGFAKSLLIDVTTAESSVAVGEIAVLRQIMEGHDLQQLQYGTSSARPVTLSFWVKSPKAGTHICELWHFTSPVRTQSQSYTVSSANTWEKHSVTFSGDTATALDDDNNYTIAVQWGLFAGTNYTSGTLATSWQNSGDTNRYVGQQNLFDNTSNNFYLTGVQLEVGDSASDFEHRSFGEELALCERYFENIKVTGYFVTGNSYSTAQFNASPMFFKTKKRSTPTITFPTVGTSSGTIGATNATANYVTQGSVLRSYSTEDWFQIYNNSSDGYSGFTDDGVMQIYSYGTTTITAESEL